MPDSPGDIAKVAMAGLVKYAGTTGYIQEIRERGSVTQNCDFKQTEMLIGSPTGKEGSSLKTTKQCAFVFRFVNVSIELKLSSASTKMIEDTFQLKQRFESEKMGVPVFKSFPFHSAKIIKVEDMKVLTL